MFGETLHASGEDKYAEEILIGDLIQGADPSTGAEKYNVVDFIAYAEEECVEISLTDGSSHRVSRSTPCAVKVAGVLSEIPARKINGTHAMFSRKGFVWCSISEIRNLGLQRVVRIKLKPCSWMFVNDVLSHNLQSIKT